MSKKKEPVHSALSTITGASAGVYKVYTETSAYIIDRNRDLGMRLPGEGLGSVDGHPVEVANLRHERTWFNLVDMHCQVGERLSLFVTGIAPGDVYTWRTGTIVRRIEEYILTSEEAGA